jgi:O-antigen ligase
MINKNALSRLDLRSFVLGITIILFSLAIGLAVLKISDPAKTAVLAIAFLAASIILINVELGLLAFVFICYTSFSEALVQSSGAPPLAEPFVLYLLLVITAHWLFFRQRPTGWERPLLVLGIFGIPAILSLTFARNMGSAYEGLADYLKCVLIVLIITSLLHRGVTLRRVLWTLIGAGIFLSIINIYQYETRTFHNSYWGFAQAELGNITGEFSDYRIAGPLGSPNAFAQILIPLVGISFERFIHEKRRTLRLIAAAGMTACSLAIIFTFSRGALIGLSVMLAIMVFRLRLKPVIFVSMGIAAIGIFFFLPAEYTERIKGLGDIPLFQNQQRDGSIQGRTSEYIAGWRMFMDHPLRGVGSGNYTEYYQDYSQKIGLDVRLQNRSPHNLYLGFAAETGIIGLSTFAVLLWFTFGGLRRTHKRLSDAGLKDDAGMVLGLMMGMIGYFTHSVFIYPHYRVFMFVLIGIAMSVPSIIHEELKAERSAT